MIGYDESQVIIKEIASLKKMACEHVALTEIENRVLAEDVVSDEDVPSFDNSAMDGFALKADETPGRFRVMSMSSAGDAAYGGKHQFSCAVEIMTGAVMPSDTDFDCVARLEDCDKTFVDGECYIDVKKALRPSENVRYRGTDIRKNEIILKSRTTLNSSHIMALASIGKSKVSVFKKLRVAIIATGSELVEVSTAELSAGKIRNSSQPYLVKSLEDLGCEVKSFGILKDDVGQFRSFLDQTENAYDIIVSTGAVSMGKYDFVHDILLEQGAQVCFHKVAIRPGKPILFAKLKTGAVYFGLPGNPISSAVGLRFFLATYVHAVHGLLRDEPIYAINSEDKSKPAGFTCFFRAILSVDHEARLKVRIHPNQASNAVQPQVETNAWAILPQKDGVARAGEKIQIITNGAFI